jgi:hypothetical protein
MFPQGNDIDAVNGTSQAMESKDITSAHAEMFRSYFAQPED